MIKSLLGTLALYFVFVFASTNMLNMFAGTDIPTLGWAIGVTMGFGIVQLWTKLHP